MKTIGNMNFIKGFQDGNLCNKQASDHPDYVEGYRRGYETAQRQTQISIARENYEHCNFNTR